MVESIPQVLANCKIQSKLGQGGMGSVYRAVHTTLGRSIALKVLPTEFTRSPEYVARFMREARAVANLNHPNIVSVHDAGEQNGIYYIAMELVDGASTGALTRNYRPLSEVEFLNFLLQAAKGMAAAHSRGLVHRDIKPENLLVSREGYLKIVDFGLVLEQTSDSHLTRTGTFLGTPVYMSPEQCDGDTADARSDLYSLGATFFSLLTGKPPFQAPTALGILYKHKFEQPPDPKSLVPDLSEHSSKILLKMLAKKREERQQNAQELIEEIEKAQKSISGKENNWSLKEALQAIKPPADVPLVFAATPSPVASAAYTPTVLPGTFDPRSATGMPAGSTPLPTTALHGQSPAYPQGATPAPVNPTPASGFEPTLVANAHQFQRTPAQPPTASQAFEPTLLTPGRMPVPQSSGSTPSPLMLTPAPTPLQEMPTPSGYTGAMQALPPKPSKLPLILGAAAAVLLLAGVGGYLGYDTLQKKQQLAKFKSDIQKYIEDGALEKAERERKAALARFSDDSELQSYESRILEGFLKRSEGEISKDIIKADEAVRAGLGFFPDDAKLKALQQKIIETFATQIEKAMKAGKTQDAQALLLAAMSSYPGNPRLFTLQKDLSAKEARADLKFEEALKKGEEAFKGADFTAAEEQYVIASKLKPSDSDLETKLRKPLFDHYMKESDDFAANSKWAEALASATKAGSFGPADERIRSIERRGKIEALRSQATTLNGSGNWRDAATKLLEASNIADDKSDAALKSQLTGQIQKWRTDGFEREIQDAEKKAQWDVAIRVIDEQIRVMGASDTLSKRLDSAKEKFSQSKDFGSAMKEGDEFRAKKNWSDARTRYQAALDKKKSDPEALAKFTEADAYCHIDNGNGLYASQDWTKAREAYVVAGDTAKKLNGAEFDALKEDIKKYIGQVDQRVQDITKSETEATKLVDSGKFPEAVKAYEDLIKLNKSRQPAYDAAIAAVKTEDQYRSWLKNGDTAVSLGKFQEASDNYRKALQKKADDPKAKEEIAKRFKIVEAYEKLQAAHELFKKSDWNGAKAAADELVKNYPDAPKEVKEPASKLLGDATDKAKKVFDRQRDADKAMADSKFLDAEQAYKDLAQLDPNNKAKYEAALGTLQAKIESQRAQLEEQRKKDEEQKKRDEEARKKEAEAKAKQDRYNNSISVAKARIASRDYEAAEAAAKAALVEFPNDAAASQLLQQIEELKKKRFDQQGETDVWNKVEPLTKQGQYAAAKQAADDGARQYPDHAATINTWSAALNLIASADASAKEASRALDSGLGVANLTGGARDTLQRAKGGLQGGVDTARQNFLGKNFTEATRSANDAIANSKRSAKDALTSAADSCSAQARAERASGGNTGGGGAKPRGNVGETELPGSEAPAPKGDEKKARMYDDAARALQQLAAGLR